MYRSQTLYAWLDSNCLENLHMTICNFRTIIELIISDLIVKREQQFKCNLVIELGLSSLFFMGTGYILIFSPSDLTAMAMWLLKSGLPCLVISAISSFVLLVMSVYSIIEAINIEFPELTFKHEIESHMSRCPDINRLTFTVASNVNHANLDQNL